MGEDKIKLLIVDDEPQILNALERQLQKEYRIFKASNSQQALEILKEKRDMPLSIVDFNLKEEKTGIELAILLKDTYPLMQILMLTGEQSMDTVISALNSGSIDAFMNKPVKSSDLKQHIEANLVIWDNRKKTVDDTINQLKLGKGIKEKDIGILGVITPILRELLKKSVDIKKHMSGSECLGVGIANEMMTLYRHFFESSFSVKNETLFAGFIESLSHLNRDLFVDAKTHNIEELKLQDASIFIRSHENYNFTIFMNRDPEDMSKFHEQIDELINEVYPLIPRKSAFLSNSLKEIITEKIKKFSRSIN